MGTPNEDIWPGVSQLPDFGMKFPNWKGQPFPVAILRHPEKNLLDLFQVINTNNQQLDFFRQNV